MPVARILSQRTIIKIGQLDRRIGAQQIGIALSRMATATNNHRPQCSRFESNASPASARMIDLAEAGTLWETLAIEGLNDGLLGLRELSRTFINPIKKSIQSSSGQHPAPSALLHDNPVSRCVVHTSMRKAMSRESHRSEDSKPATDTYKKLIAVGTMLHYINSNTLILARHHR